MNNGETLELVFSGEEVRPKKTDEPCPVCFSVFHDSTLLKVHMKTHMRQFVLMEDRLECSECGKRFSLRAAFSNHVKIHSNPNSRALRRLKSERPHVDPADPPCIDNGPDLKEDEDKPYVACFMCLAQTRCSKLGAHLQRHASLLQRSCEEIAEILDAFEVQLNPESDE